MEPFGHNVIIGVLLSMALQGKHIYIHIILLWYVFSGWPQSMALRLLGIIPNTDIMHVMGGRQTALISWWNNRDFVQLQY